MLTDDGWRRTVSTARLFKLIHTEDIGGMSHVADGVIFKDGACALRFCAQSLTIVCESFEDVVKTHLRNGKMRVEMFDHPYELGKTAAIQDSIDNIPCKSIGGLKARQAPIVPEHVREDDRVAWCSGYTDACNAMYGPMWRVREIP